MANSVVFLHIGKTGGTAVREALHSQPGKKKGFKVLGHRWTLAEILKREEGEQVIFFIREPGSRFVSAFNSRLRQGLPRYFSPWSKKEEAAFKRFKSPNELAEALSSWNPFRRHAAIAAIKAIKHCRLGYSHYLTKPQFLEKHKERIYFIGELENIQGDFDLLKQLTGADPGLVLPADDIKSHKAPDDLAKKLSMKAVKNLKKYFRNDYKIYEWCKAHKDVILSNLHDHGISPESREQLSSSVIPEAVQSPGQARSNVR